MEYLDTRFTHAVRFTLLTVFITLFFVISPIIIMYTAGYRYDFKNGLLKETGAISIDILPKNTAIYLNNIRLKYKMPVRLNNITPNKYNLRMTASGYYDWTKDIEVKNKQTVYIKEISLIQNNQPQLALKENVEQIALSYTGAYLAYSVNKNNDTEIWLRNNTDNSASVIQKIPDTVSTTITWSEKNNFFVIANAAPPYNILWFINADNPQSKINVSQNEKKSILKYQISNTAEASIFFSTAENIISYTPVNNSFSTFTKNTFVDWFMENGQLWTMQTDTSTEQYKIIRDTLGFSVVFNTVEKTPDGNYKNWRIASAVKNTILLKNKQSAQIMIATADKKFLINGDKFLISKYNNWWLIWNQYELWTYTEGEDPNLLNRSGEHLQEVLPMDEYNTLALFWTNKTTSLFPYYLVTHDLINEKIRNPIIDTDKKIIYYIREKNNEIGVWTLAY